MDLLEQDFLLFERRAHRVFRLLAVADIEDDAAHARDLTFLLDGDGAHERGKMRMVLPYRKELVRGRFTA